MTEQKRILFVDDEPLVLQGLKRVLRPMRKDWEMEFVDGGETALERMAETPFDVVVSDMRMPGMNGAELLTRVMQRHPSTVRLILSGHADRELILKCVGSTHQFLAKPCDPNALKSAVQRAAGLDAALKTDCIRLLICQIKALPMLPVLYREIVELLNRPDSSSEDVALLIAQDTDMTEKILKLVNSTCLGSRHAIHTPKDAVAYAGLDIIRSLVLALSTFAQFKNVAVNGMSADTVWGHSLSVASRARQLARIETNDPKLMDEAFVAGLLHDLGKLIIAGGLPDEFRESVRMAEEDRVQFHIAEEVLLGANHGDAGGYLLGLWGLPVPIVEGITFHHRPSRGTQLSFTPLTAVHVADVIEHELAPGRATLVPPRLDTNYLESIGLTDRVDAWRKALESDELNSPTT